MADAAARSVDEVDEAALSAEYERDAAAKEARIAALLDEAGLPGLFRGMRRCPVERGYRMRASFYRAADGGGPVGVDPRHGRVPLEQSLWVIPDHARPLVREVGRRIAAAQEQARITGFEVRLEFGSGRAHLTLAVERGAAALDSLCAELMAEVDGVFGVAVPSQRIEAGETEHRHELLGKTILAHHRAFFQTNRWLTADLAAAAQAAAGDPSRIVDLYCGVGLHSVLAATPGSAVVGVDTNGWAIDSAVRNAALHGLAHARFERLPVEKLAPGGDGPPSVVFVNPSRFGCAPGLAERIAAWRPAAVCLVSCSIGSHARDLASFVRAGYQPRPFESFDMFPFSDFVESVTELRRG
jgi:tRNA/tmRNA/rRNA uracil-C5-methylase (TrmA/RlmC/RlmD family)